MIIMSTPHRMTFEATMTGLHQKEADILNIAPSDTEQ